MDLQPQFLLILHFSNGIIFYIELGVTLFFVSIWPYYKETKAFLRKTHTLFDQRWYIPKRMKLRNYLMKKCFDKTRLKT